MANIREEDKRRIMATLDLTEEDLRLMNKMGPIAMNTDEPYRKSRIPIITELPPIVEVYTVHELESIDEFENYTAPAFNPIPLTSRMEELEALQLQVDQQRMILEQHLASSKGLELRHGGGILEQIEKSGTKATYKPLTKGDIEKAVKTMFDKASEESPHTIIMGMGSGARKEFAKAMKEEHEKMEQGLWFGEVPDPRFEGKSDIDISVILMSLASEYDMPEVEIEEYKQAIHKELARRGSPASTFTNAYHVDIDPPIKADLGALVGKTFATGGLVNEIRGREKLFHVEQDGTRREFEFKLKSSSPEPPIFGGGPAGEEGFFGSIVSRVRRSGSGFATGLDKREREK